MFEPVEGKSLYRTTEDTDFIVNGHVMPIPKGFEFNGSSIPRMFWPIVGSPFDPKFMVAALNHDYCFLTHCCSFNEANALFYNDLRVAGVSVVISWTKRIAVSTAGYFVWRKKDVEGLKKLRALLDARPDGGYYKMFIGRKI